jgi:glycine/D-amino acid oxidase-like deaminating enzyme
VSGGENKPLGNWSRGFSRSSDKRAQPAEASAPAQHAAVLRSGSVPAHLQRSPDAVIVGGGLIGSSIAYHLARAGVRTLLIEQGDLASGASGANFGNVQVEDAEFGLSLELTLRSYARFATLEDELDYDLNYRRSGNLLLIENERQWSLMRERLAHLRAAGVRAELLGCDETRRLESSLAPEAIAGALYNPDEGTLDPFRLVHAYSLRGRGAGLEVWTHTRVAGIEVRGGRVTRVTTPLGSVPAQWVILATGAWARGLGRTAGVELPVEWVHGEALITEPLPPAARNAMTTAAFFEATEGADEQSVGFCLRQRPRGNVMLGEAARVTRRLGRESTLTALPAVAVEARRWLPVLRRAAVIRSWAIPVAFVPDSRPLLGPVDGVAGLLVATGLKSTIILTPLVGELVAGMVTGATQDPRLAEFSPSRTVGA